MAPLHCPVCEEDDPETADGVCLTCGEEVIDRPAPSASGQASQAAAAPGAGGRAGQAAAPGAGGEEDGDNAGGGDAAAAALRRLAEAMAGGTAVDAASLAPLIAGLRDRNPGPGLGAGAGGAGTAGGGIGDLAGLLPAEALNPQAGGGGSRPASKAAVDGLRRTVLTERSAELFEARVRLYPSRSAGEADAPAAGEECLELDAVPGEFGVSSTVPGGAACALVLCNPRTARGGLSRETLDEVGRLRRLRLPFVAYVARGDGVTFVRKAIACQEAGKPAGGDGRSLCRGVVVGNTGDVWPYSMRDTGGEAESLGLEVPVVMVRREDGARLVRWAEDERRRRGVSRRDGGARDDEDDDRYVPCRLEVSPREGKDNACPVCAEPYAPGDVTVRLPCGHAFHDACAVAWLRGHNTCPYCREEMRTDDGGYEAERRRRRRGEGGGGGGVDDGVGFYG